MTISLHTSLSRKYAQPAIVMADPYSEDRDGSLYLVNADGVQGVLCSAIVSIEIL